MTISSFIVNFLYFGTQASKLGVLFTIDGESGGLETFACDFHVDGALLAIALDANDELSVEGFHRGLGEDFDAGGIAIADTFERGGS